MLGDDDDTWFVVAWVVSFLVSLACIGVLIWTVVSLVSWVMT